ncbi:hypothetical protein HJC99_06895 [Candidatus Saccharibacteria bacterium]|nr:hypothetical protein [Candidatus Saccharibacteria bacterium]
MFWIAELMLFPWFWALWTINSAHVVSWGRHATAVSHGFIAFAVAFSVIILPSAMFFIDGAVVHAHSASVSGRIGLIAIRFVLWPAWMILVLAFGPRLTHVRHGL